MIKKEMVKVLAIAFELDSNLDNNDNSILMLWLLEESWLVEKEYIDEVIDWFEDENLRKAVIFNNDIAEEVKKSLNKIIRYLNSKDFNKSKYSKLVNLEVDRIDKILEKQNYKTQQDISWFKNKKMLAYKMLDFIKDNKGLLNDL